MITNKQDLKEFLEADRIALGRKRKQPAWNDFIWKFEISLRMAEYYHNTKGGYLHHLIGKYHGFKMLVWGGVCGYDICLNVFDKGLSIAHKGTIVTNGNARIGKNCRIHTCVNIGTLPGTSGLAPKIGDNVYIGPGAKIYGNIRIADNIVIGANAVVGRSFEEPNVCIAGAPARKISEKGRFDFEKSNNQFEKIK